MWRAGLRRGSIVALDLDDYDPGEQSLEIVHRPDSETALKTKQRGERFVGLVDETRACSAGEYFYISPGTVHRDRTPPDEDTVVLVSFVGSGPVVVNVDSPDAD